VLTWLLALLAGAGLGLFLAWYVLPVSYTGAEPYDLGSRDKDDYIRMIAASYAVENSYELANRRLYYLQLPDVRTRLNELARAETNPLTQQALVKLGVDMDRPAVALGRATSTPRPTRDLTPLPRITVIVIVPPTPLPTLPPPTRAPSPIPPTTEPNPTAPRFELAEKRALDCATTGGSPVIRVEVQDAAGNGLAGVRIEVNSDLGTDQFLTGFKPERGNGYGDASVPPGTYAVHLVENARSEVVSDLRIDANVVECGSSPTATLGWYLVFRQKLAQ